MKQPFILHNSSFPHRALHVGECVRLGLGAVGVRHVWERRLAVRDPLNKERRFLPLRLAGALPVHPFAFHPVRPSPTDFGILVPADTTDPDTVAARERHGPTAGKTCVEAVKETQNQQQPKTPQCPYGMSGRVTRRR